MAKLDLDFENGFWADDGWYPDDNIPPLVAMWQNFTDYCSEKNESREEILRNEFNASAQMYAGEYTPDEYGEYGDYDDQWFVRFDTPEDYAMFVVRFA